MSKLDKENKFYVYGLFDSSEDNFLDSIFYVGKGCGDRLNEHFHEYNLNVENSKNPHKTRKILKLRRNNKNPMSLKIFKKLNEIKALDLEEMLIDEIGLKKLTNMIPGGGVPLYGENNPMYNVSLTGKDNPLYGTERSEKFKKNHSERMSGEGNSFYGKSHTEEAKKKISKANLNRSFTDEQKRKFSEAQKKRFEDPKEREKLSRSLSGKNNPMYDKEHSDKTKKKISNSLKGKTHSDQVKDKMSKSSRGVNGNKTKLDKEKVMEIKWILENTELYKKDIGDIYNVSGTMISSIEKEKSWEYIDKIKEPKNIDFDE